MLNSISSNIFSSFYDSAIRSWIPTLSVRGKAITGVATAILASLALLFVYRQVSNRCLRQVQPIQPKTKPVISITPTPQIIITPRPITNPQLTTPQKNPTGVFQAQRLALENWLNQNAKKYPLGYCHPNSISLILTRLDQSADKQQFHKKINRLKDERWINGNTAYHIKKQFERLMAAPVNQPVAQPIRVPAHFNLIDPTKVDPALQAVHGGLPTCPWNALPLDITSLGMTVTESQDSFPWIDDQLRYGVRDATEQAVFNWLSCGPVTNFKKQAEVGQNIQQPTQLHPIIQQYLSQVILFTPKNDIVYNSKNEMDNKYMSQPTQLLGRFDVLATPCIMDYNAQWQFIGNQPHAPFWVHHGAALNIGESARRSTDGDVKKGAVDRHAPDFKDYSMNGKLDKAKYLRDMGTIFHQMLAAQQYEYVKHAVWFPFGMGAFLRQLPDNDPTYKNRQILAELRQEIAATFVAQLDQFPQLQIHMCLPLDKTPGSDTQQNYNGFVQAFAKASAQTKKNVQFYINIDATDLAQRLADRNYIHGGRYTVSLANGSNRNMIGNHWFENYAKKAIEENLFRRSTLLALLALILNSGAQIRDRKPQDLPKRVGQFGPGQDNYIAV